MCVACLDHLLLHGLLAGVRRVPPDGHRGLVQRGVGRRGPDDGPAAVDPELGLLDRGLHRGRVLQVGGRPAELLGAALEAHDDGGGELQRQLELADRGGGGGGGGSDRGHRGGGGGGVLPARRTEPSLL